MQVKAMKNKCSEYQTELATMGKRMSDLYHFEAIETS